MCCGCSDQEAVTCFSSMACNCNCTDCNFAGLNQEGIKIANITLSGEDHESFCSSDNAYGDDRYRLACTSYLEDGMDKGSTKIIIVLSIACLVFLFVICILVVRKINDNKEIQQLKEKIPFYPNTSVSK